MARNATLGWLHLTDLHAGQPKEGGRLDPIEQEFIKDLERVSVEEDLPIGLVFFSGDIAFRGSDGEYVRASAFLGRILRRIEDLNRERGAAHITPILLPVPGNHDLARPSAAEAESVKMAFAARKPTSAPLWAPGEESVRGIVDGAFAGYERWLQHPLPFPPGWRAGLLPGDRSVTVARDGISVGVLCINGAYLHLGNDGPGSLHLDNSQVHHLCRRLSLWKARHDHTVLMTHHPGSWFSEVARRTLDREVLGNATFDLHLFGHEHVGAHEARPGSTGIRHLLQGRSLFGAEEGGSGRIHGYTVGRFELRDDQKRIKIRPRRGWEDDSGWHFGPIREDAPGTWRMVIEMGQLPGARRTASPTPTQVDWNKNLGNLNDEVKDTWKETYEDLENKPKRTRWVFLSASIPTPRGDAARRGRNSQYVETARLELIAETVLGLAGALEDAGVGLVFGGHPSITQMLAPLVLEPGRRKDPWLILFQHERFWDSFVEDVGVMAWMEGVTCVLTRRTGGGEDLKTEMARMRESMLEVPGIEAAVFVGGLDGIEEEYDLVKEKLPGIRRFAVGVGGGAAAELLLGKGLEAAGHLKGEAKRSRPPLPEDTAPLWHSPDRAVDTILAALGITPEP